MDNLRSQSAPYLLYDAQWPEPRNVITYSFATRFIPSDGERDDSVGGAAPAAWHQTVVREAMDAWEAVCGVTFREVSDSASADVRIGFQPLRGSSAPDLYESDGVDGTAGITWTWSIGTRITAQSIAFDPADSSHRTQFYDTALHELGHVLGLNHSDVKYVVMSGGLNDGTGTTPYWGGVPGRNPLQPDDVAGAVALWGPAAGSPPTPVGPTSGDDVLSGTPAGDTIDGEGGNDRIDGRGGDDTLRGSGGDDILIGGPDGSTLFGQAGADTFVFSGGQNWFMDFDQGAGDRIAGLDATYLEANGNTQQVGDHLAIYFGENPWDANGPGTIWLANTTGLPAGDILYG